MISEGDRAPDFELFDKGGKIVKLSDFIGKKVVIYFYPKDNTPGCTRQACAFRNAYDEFQKREIIVIGISKDSMKSHINFAKKYSLPFVLLSDPEQKAIKAYGVSQEKKIFGLFTIGVNRSTFVIGESGKVIKVFSKANPKTNASDILAALESLH